MNENQNPYPEEILDPNADDGTMPANVDRLRESVVGRRIVKAEQGDSRWLNSLTITLDDGTAVRLRDNSDCCAYTDLESFLLHPDKVDHVIMGVGTTDGYTRWHIYADMGDIMELTVGWSCGNPFYYGYGFDIDVMPISD